MKNKTTVSANMDEEDIEMQALLSSPKHYTHRAAFFTHSKNQRTKGSSLGDYLVTLAWVISHYLAYMRI
jgi:hypothetical protein